MKTKGNLDFLEMATQSMIPAESRYLFTLLSIPLRCMVRVLSFWLLAVVWTMKNFLSEDTRFQGTTASSFLRRGLLHASLELPSLKVVRRHLKVLPYPMPYGTKAHLSFLRHLFNGPLGVSTSLFVWP